MDSKHDPLHHCWLAVTLMFVCIIGLPWLFSDLGDTLDWSVRFTSELSLWSMLGSVLVCAVYGSVRMDKSYKYLRRSIQNHTVEGICSLLWATRKYLDSTYVLNTESRYWRRDFNRDLQRDLQEGRNALMQVLPQLQSADASRLTHRDRQLLNKILGYQDIALTLAVLRALERVGDEMAVVDVRRLAAGRGKTGHDAQVRAAACQTLICLEERIQQQKQYGSVSLLRASQEPAQAQEAVLLRASTEQAREKQEQQLLRAGAGGQEQTEQTGNNFVR